VPLQLELVHGDRLRGVTAAGNIVEHTALVGTRIGISAKVEDQLKQYEIIIGGVAPIVTSGGAGPEEWFWVGAQRPIEAYDFVYTPIGTEERRPLCAEVDGNPSRLRGLVFGGDLYDPRTKAITTGPETGGWFNIACLESAIYKMHKIGYTSAAQDRLGIVTTIEQRRAMLNAWTANVCGTGQPFTQPGELITLRESLDLLPPGNGYLDPLDPAKTQSIEAIWDETGAVCMNTARLDEDDNKIYQKIRTACGGKLPESCDGKVDNWAAHGLVLTGNPPPPPPMP
jgi:hypothetical protein